MRHLAYFPCLLLFSSLILHRVQSILVDPYRLPPSQQEIAHLLQQHNAAGEPSLPAAYSYQSQTIIHGNPQLTAGAAQQTAANYNYAAYDSGPAAADSSSFAVSTPTTMQPLLPPPAPPPPPPQLWSAAPIVVGYDGGDDYVEELLRLRPQQVNNAQVALLSPPPPYLQPPIFAGNLQTRTSSPPQYFEGYSRSPPDLFKMPLPSPDQRRPAQIPPAASSSFYYQQQLQQQQRARALFQASAMGRDSSTALSSLEAQNALLSALHVPDYTSEYAPHFERYVDKHPRRLLPNYEVVDNESDVKKK